MESSLVVVIIALAAVVALSLWIYRIKGRSRAKNHEQAHAPGYDLMYPAYDSTDMRDSLLQSEGEPPAQEVNKVHPPGHDLIQPMRDSTDLLSVLDRRDEPLV